MTWCGSAGKGNRQMTPSSLGRAISDIYQIVPLPIDVEELRTRLRKMSNADLRRFGRAARLGGDNVARRVRTGIEWFEASATQQRIDE